MFHPEDNIKAEELGEPGITRTTMWFLFAIIISFTAGFVIFGYIAPKPAAFVQYIGDVELDSSMMTVSSCEKKLTEIRDNKKAYAASHPDDIFKDVQSFCIR